MKVVPKFPLPSDPTYDYNLIPSNKELTITKKVSTNNRLSRNIITDYPHLLNSNQHRQELNPFYDNKKTINSNMAQEVLNSRLEVESTSTTSLPISYPYYYLEDYSPSNQLLLQNHESNKSADTFELLKSINPPQKEISPPKKAIQPTMQVSPNRYNDYNQIPKRFSQFIIDQQNPYISQRLDNLDDLNEDNLSSIKTNDNEKGNSSIQKSFSLTNNSKTKRSSANQSQHDEFFNNSGQLSRNISNSMESQATIFSTRQKSSSESNERVTTSRRIGSRNLPSQRRGTRQPHIQKHINNSLRKSKSLFQKKPKSRTSNVQLYHNDSTNSSIINSSIQSSSSLIRTNAIKSKRGSLWYRFKLQLVKLLNKFKFYSFKASSKRARGSIKRSKSKSIKRSNTKNRESCQNQDIKRLASIKLLPPHKLNKNNNNSNYLKISNPSTNPNLGSTPIYHVSKMDKNLKNSMGATNNQNLSHEEIVNENLGKYNHLTNYINQQDKNYLQNKSTLKIQNNKPSRIIEELPSPQIDNEEDDEIKTNLQNVEPSLVASIATLSSQQPPLPPPHIDQSYLTKKRIISNVSINKEKRIQLIWNSYLKQVLSKRIQLRLEILNYQNFLTNRETSNFINKIFEEIKLEQLKDERNSNISYQNSLISKNSSNSSSFNNKFIHPNAKSPSIHSSIYSHTSTTTTTTEENDDQETISTSSTKSYENEHGDIFIELDDESQENQDKAFNKFINRRSMLGEMLEYNSSEESEDSDESDGDDEEQDDDDDEQEDVYSIQQSINLKSPISLTHKISNRSNTNSIKSETLVKKYGTINKKSSTKKLKQIVMTNDIELNNQMSYETDIQNSPLKRSFGLNHNLNKLST
ncbi:uncharacterized protein KGF55_000877 [Candida pseudojiufengensis]|uniref:uncharacterized protein n=1 Tax=Candida pseudojiufengensis TaxID=497109 RepID=UPI0022250C91|nr:uncharacterized protein KGF55_000877 [Candida pseudojiufengensis]KAI5966568.1 hypothetical protein KGF55_000877 [Candida pseudojiufengensis]